MSTFGRLYDNKNILRRASVDIHSGNLENAAKLFDALKDEHRLSSEVTRLWCLLTRRTGKAGAVPAYAAKTYAHVEGDVHKTRWAHIMGTAKITNHAKGCDTATGGHIEKASWLKSRDNFNLKSTFINIFFAAKYAPAW